MITSQVKNFKVGDKVVLSEEGESNTNCKLINQVLEITGYNTSSDGLELYYQLNNGTDLWYDQELVLLEVGNGIEVVSET